MSHTNTDTNTDVESVWSTIPNETVQKRRNSSVTNVTFDTLPVIDGIANSNRVTETYPLFSLNDLLTLNLDLNWSNYSSDSLMNMNSGSIISLDSTNSNSYSDSDSESIIPHDTTQDILTSMSHRLENTSMDAYTRVLLSIFLQCKDYFPSEEEIKLQWELFDKALKDVELGILHSRTNNYDDIIHTNTTRTSDSTNLDVLPEVDKEKYTLKMYNVGDSIDIVLNS